MTRATSPIIDFYPEEFKVRTPPSQSVDMGLAVPLRHVCCLFRWT
jgi:hypothetical protein